MPSKRSRVRLSPGALSLTPPLMRRSKSRRSKSRRSRSRSSPRLSPKPYSHSPLVAERSTCVGKIDIITTEPIEEDDMIEFMQTVKGKTHRYCFDKSALRQWAKISATNPGNRAPLPQSVMDELFPRIVVSPSRKKYYASCFLEFTRKPSVIRNTISHPPFYVKSITPEDGFRDMSEWIDTKLHSQRVFPIEMWLGNSTLVSEHEKRFDIIESDQTRMTEEVVGQLTVEVSEQAPRDWGGLYIELSDSFIPADFPFEL